MYLSQENENWDVQCSLVVLWRRKSTDSIDEFQLWCSETLSAIGGNYVLNSGTLVGPSIMMRDYFDLLTQEMENRWQCRREHGSDQAMHNFLVYNQKVSEAGKIGLLRTPKIESSRAQSRKGCVFKMLMRIHFMWVFKAMSWDQHFMYISKCLRNFPNV